MQRRFHLVLQFPLYLFSPLHCGFCINMQMESATEAAGASQSLDMCASIWCRLVF